MDTLDGKDEDHVLSLLGGPETFPVLRLVDNLPTPDIPNAPDYIVYPVRFRGVASSLLQPRVRLDGFFDLWDTHNQPFERDPELITMSYAAPELATDGVCSLPIDLWALGCLLFTIRTGAELFRSVQNRSLYDPEDDDSPEEARKDYFDAVCKVLSKPPGLWSRYYSPEKPSYMRPEPDRSHPETEAERRQRRLAGIRRAIRSNLKRPDSLYTYTHWLSRLPPMEVRTLADLLERLLRYEPHERIDASAVLQHAWFNGLDDGVAK